MEILPKEILNLYAHNDCGCFPDRPKIHLGGSWTGMVGFHSDDATRFVEFFLFRTEEYNNKNKRKGVDHDGIQTVD